eukprot:5714981-Prymnesium_polylepis.2
MGRRLVNEDEILAAITSTYGATVNMRVVDFAELTMREQVRATWESDVFSGLHGAGYGNVLWLRPKSAVVEILPIGWAPGLYANLARLLGSTFLAWMNPYPQMQQDFGGKGINLSIAWPTLQPTMDEAIEAARRRRVPATNFALDWAGVTRPYHGPPPTNHPGWHQVSQERDW